MSYLAPLLFIASLLALSSAAPLFRYPTNIGDFERARSQFSISWSPGEKALMQRISITWKNKQKAFLQGLLDDLNDDEKAVLQGITISWKNKQKAFLQGLLDSLNDDEKAALQRFSISFGNKERASLQQAAPDFSQLLKLFGAPDSDTAEQMLYLPSGIGEANAEQLSTADILSIISDVASKVSDRLGSNGLADAENLRTADILSILSKVASNVADRLNSNGGTAKEEDFDFGDAVKTVGTLVTLFG